MSDALAIAEISRKSLREKPDHARRLFAQFFTPPAISRQMASLSTHSSSSIRFLDAGAGGGALTAAWVAAVCSRPRPPREISLTAIELDERLLPELEQTLKACARACADVGIHCRWEARHADFIQMAVHALSEDLFHTNNEKFDAALLNPPYKKLRSDSVNRELLRRVGIETSNLYAAFLSLAVLLLDKQGELIAITPRSFCNGPYFRPFREHLLRYTNLSHFHIFESRNQAFREDEVLQENVIMRVVRGVPQQAQVLITQSRTPDDPEAIRNTVAFDQVVKNGDPQKFFHLVPDENGHEVARFMEALPCTLPDLGLSASTGRVVDFRARQWLRMESEKGTVPLIYPVHFENGCVFWPKSQIRKPNAIVSSEETSSLMVPMGVYTLVRRFSAKEERRRVVAAVFHPSAMAPFEVVGFENHLNYFHQQGRPLDLFLARGLAGFLNSTVVDSYFRQFNGHTQVNAEDLRALRYPTLNVLIALGRRIGNTLPEQNVLDSIVEGIIGRNENKHKRTSNSRSPSGVGGVRSTKRTAKRTGRAHTARPSGSPTSKTLD